MIWPIYCCKRVYDTVILFQTLFIATSYWIAKGSLYCLALSKNLSAKDFREFYQTIPLPLAPIWQVEKLRHGEARSTWSKGESDMEQATPGYTFLFTYAYPLPSQTSWKGVDSLRLIWWVSIAMSFQKFPQVGGGCVSEKEVRRKGPPWSTPVSLCRFICSPQNPASSYCDLWQYLSAVPWQITA